MELTNIPAVKYQDKQSVKKILKYCGPEKYEVYDEPLADLSHEEVVQLVLKWIGYNSKHGQSLDIRMRIEEFATTCSLKFTNRNRAVHITRFGKRPM